MKPRNANRVGRSLAFVTVKCTVLVLDETTANDTYAPRRSPTSCLSYRRKSTCDYHRSNSRTAGAIACSEHNGPLSGRPPTCIRPRCPDHPELVPDSCKGQINLQQKFPTPSIPSCLDQRLTHMHAEDTSTTDTQGEKNLVTCTKYNKRSFAQSS
jgi:hypothetical protein